MYKTSNWIRVGGSFELVLGRVVNLSCISSSCKIMMALENSLLVSALAVDHNMSTESR